MKRGMFSLGFAALIGCVGMAWADGSIENGKAKAGGCGGCHGASGEGRPPTPALAGMKKERFEKAMKDYQAGKGNSAMMTSLAKPLSKGDIEDLAAYFASLKGK